MKIDESKLTVMGSMNYIVQVWKYEEKDMVQVDQYQPRRNRVWSGEMPKEEAHQQITETIERMKIAIQLFEEFLAGKREYVYYWEYEDNKP